MNTYNKYKFLILSFIGIIVVFSFVLFIKKDNNIQCAKSFDSYSIDGFVTEKIPVHITLECDSKTVTITGSVNQVLKLPILKSPTTTSEPKQDTEPLSADEAISLSNDWNFDDYMDLDIFTGKDTTSNGSLITHKFVFDKTSNQFVYIPSISITDNLIPFPDKKILVFIDNTQNPYVFKASIKKWPDAGTSTIDNTLLPVGTYSCITTNEQGVPLGADTTLTQKKDNLKTTQTIEIVNPKTGAVVKKDTKTRPTIITDTGTIDSEMNSCDWDNGGILENPIFN